MQYLLENFLTVLHRLKEYIDRKGLSISAFEKSIGMSNASFGKSLKNDGTIGADKIENILNVYPDINIEWLITGKGPMLKTDIAGGGNVTFTPAPYGKGIPLVPYHAMCGVGFEAFSDVPTDDFYFVRQFRDADFLIRCQGDSMTPKYSSGDLVACRIVKERLFFQWNHIYAVSTLSQGIMIKRVRSCDDPSQILLVSENPSYAPFTVPLDDVISVALVLGAITLE